MGDQPVSSTKKRKHGLDADTESESEAEAENVPGARALVRNNGRDQGKEKRREQLGKKQMEKEVYRKEKIRRVDDQGKQWGR